MKSVVVLVVALGCLAGAVTTLAKRGAPSVTKLSFSPSTFAVAPASAASASQRQATTIRLTLSERATIRVEIARKLAGRSAHGRCVKPTAKLSKRRACTHYATVGKLARGSRKAGRVAIAFSGRIHGKVLKPGAYRATIIAVDKSKHHSKPKTATFTVTRRRQGASQTPSGSNPAPSQGANSTPPPPGGFPNPASTGVPAGWTPAQTRSTDLTVTTPGAVVQDTLFTNGAKIVVMADNVTIRRVDMQGGYITNQYGAAPANCGHNMLVEDTTFEQIPGQFAPSDFPVIGEGSYTARRIEVEGRGEGPRLSNCGPVTLEDSFIKIHGADQGTPQCEQVHSDGVQGYDGVGATARNNTIIFETYCGTSPWFVANNGNTGVYNVDRLLVSGAGFTFRQNLPGSVTGLRIVNNSWVYGPLDQMNCSVISPWEAKLVTIDSNYQVTGTVRNLPCGNS
jgi:hypothetical protein